MTRDKHLVTSREFNVVSGKLLDSGIEMRACALLFGVSDASWRWGCALSDATHPVRLR